MDAEQPEGEPTSRRLFRMAVVFVITTLLLMTQGFGTFPANEISSALAQTVTANLPAPLIDALDGYLDVLGAPALSAVASNFSTGKAQAKVDNKENVVVVRQTIKPDATRPDVFAQVTPVPVNTPQPIASASPRSVPTTALPTQVLVETNTPPASIATPLVMPAIRNRTALSSPIPALIPALAPTRRPKPKATQPPVVASPTPAPPTSEPAPQPAPNGQPQSSPSTTTPDAPERVPATATAEALPTLTLTPIPIPTLTLTPIPEPSEIPIEQTPEPDITPVPPTTPMPTDAPTSMPIATDVPTTGPTATRTRKPRADGTPTPQPDDTNNPSQGSAATTSRTRYVRATL